MFDKLWPQVKNLPTVLLCPPVRPWSDVETNLLENKKYEYYVNFI